MFRREPPRYSGGVLPVLMPGGPSSPPVEAVAACRCEAGRIYHERPTGPMGYFDDLHPEALFEQSLPAGQAEIAAEFGRRE